MAIFKISASTGLDVILHTQAKGVRGDLSDPRGEQDRWDFPISRKAAARCPGRSDPAAAYLKA
jgi:hypothetical protein